MRVTWDDRLDLDLTAAATCADLLSYLEHAGERPEALWCGAVRLDADHRAGVPPLVHGASLHRNPYPPAALLDNPHLAVVCGPDAGRMVPLTRAGISIGRSESCDLRLGDDAVSQDHARAGFDTAAWVRDEDSRNGTVLIRRDGTRKRARRLRPSPGEHLVLGSSVAQVRPLPPADEASRRRPLASGTQLSAMAAGAMTGILLAVMTGRWYFALLALAYPLMTGLPILVQRARRREPGAGVNPPVDPCPHLDLSSREPPHHATSAEGQAPAPLPGPIAVLGERDRAMATARAVVLAQQLRPHDDAWSEPWMRWLPRAPREHTVLVVPHGKAAPSWAATVVEAHATETHVRTGTATRQTPTCWINEDTADALARLIAGTRDATGLPRDVAWADLDAPTAHAPGRTLATPIGLSARGGESLDLDAHGPHLLVAGTTGAGKSALLETLVLGLAHAHSPADLTIALIDFKGGAGLRHCMGLPHVVGCLTDLDRHLADRALVALSAELADRKSQVAQAGYGSFGEWESAGGAPPRLLVVADEYQEIAQHHREFLPHLARLAAQGRSLGLHLVLATQRPAGAVTPEIRANVTTTIALRVASAAESQDLLGTADAAALPVDRPGRAIIAFGARHITVQVARPTVTATAPVRPAGHVVESAPAELAAAAAARWGGEVLEQLWRDPLPDHVALTDDGGLPGQATGGCPTGGGLVLGLADWPIDRRQGYVSWDPTTGPLAVVGPRGSGRTTALVALGDQAHAHHLVPVWLPADARAAARTLALCRDRDDVLLLIDDAAGAVGTLAEVDRGAPADLLARRLARGLPTAIALATHDPPRLAAAVGTRVILTGADPADDALWNVPRALAGLPAARGRGRLGTQGAWCEVQLCEPSGDTPPAQSLVSVLPTGAQVAARCGVDGHLLAVGGDDAHDLYLESAPVTVVGPPSPERDAVVAHVGHLEAATESACSAALGTPNAPELPPAVTVRDDLVSFPGSTRPRGTIIVMQPTERSVRDACGAMHVGLCDPVPQPGRVVIVTGTRACAAQLPVTPGVSESTAP